MGTYEMHGTHITMHGLQLYTVSIGGGNSSSVCSGDEEDDNWMPEEVKGEGHGKEEEDGEDVAGLIADAEEFIGNKKMRR